MEYTSKEIPFNSIEKKFAILLAIFIACIVFINVISAKLFSAFGLTMSAGIIAYWITFPITDVIGEVFGRKRAYFVVIMGLVTNIIILIFSHIVIELPPSPFYAYQDSLSKVLGAVPLVIFASLSAYFCSQLFDVWVFDFFKDRTKGKYLWLRNNLSTFLSQFIDSLIFNSIAFYLFADDKMPILAFLSMTLGFWLFKVSIAVLDTPIVYALVAWLKKDIKTTQ